MVVPEARVTVERLAELLAVGTETPHLDYKEVLDLSATKDRVELAKDIGAFEVDGGYILVGADSHGNPTGRLEPDMAREFDEARLRQILKKWLPDPLDLLVAVHEHDGNHFVLIYVGPNPHGLAIFKADGQHGDGKNTTTVFREGDVFVRDGTQSRRWQQPDFARILAAVRERQKEEWLGEFRSDLVEVVRAGTDATTLATGPISAVTWQLDRVTLLDALTELVRRGDHTALALFFDRVVADAEGLLGSHQLDELRRLLDQVACVASLLLRVGHAELLDRAIAAFESIYGLSINAQGLDRDGTAPVEISQVRLDIVVRLAALGALAVRKKSWDVVPEIVLRRPPHREIQSGLYTNWFRHAVTWAARHNLLEKSDGSGTKATGFLSHVLVTIERSPCLHADLPVEEASSDDRVVNSVVQFDVLANLTVLARAPGDRDFPYYPSFAPFYWSRFEGLLARAVTDPELRSAVHPGTDAELAADITTLLNGAKKEGFMFAGGGPLSDQRLIAFLNTHRPHD